MPCYAMAASLHYRKYKHREKGYTTDNSGKFNLFLKGSPISTRPFWYGLLKWKHLISLKFFSSIKSQENAK